MNIEHWFLPGTASENSEKSSFFKFRDEDIHSERESEDFDLILMSVQHMISVNFRKTLTRLHNHFSSLKMFDAGNVRESNPEFIVAPVSHYMEQRKLPVVLGGDYTLAKSLSEQKGQKITHVSNALPPIETIDEGSRFIGYQRHLCDYKALKFTEEFCPDSLSLGQMKSNPHLLEPILRDTEILYIHLNVLRSAELPGSVGSWPSGLNTEDLCQIARFAGNSLYLKAVIVDFSEVEETSQHIESKMLTEIFWYVLEGIKCRQSDHPMFNTNISEYVVNMADFDTELVFIRSNITHRWWLRVQDNDSLPYLSCAHEEYQQSIHNDIPERLLRHVL